MGNSITPIEALKAQPYFKALDERELKNLARTLIERSYAKDEVVFLEGEPSHGLYIVREGTVKVYKLSPEGREQILTYTRAGGSFNEVAVFDGGPNPANVSSSEPATLWIVPRAAIIELIQQRPEVALAIIQNLGARLRHLVGLVEDLSLRQVTARLAKLLLQTASGQERGLTQQEMAARLGTVREMIGRSLRQLEGRGFIKLEHGRIVILDRAGLEKIV
ncbi:MAG: Crp/Fnr family transcriptional regulator [Chloroflexi bacterium]|nr:Crp/Fnr family transcriptional regulator [Chloroflexota bacterium]